MARRRFEHLMVELSVAAGRVVPRYALWLRLGEIGTSPDHLSRGAALSFCDAHLEIFLAEHSLSIEPRARRRLRRAVENFDARQPTPYEWMERVNHASE
jgi:hypothetical protein